MINAEHPRYADALAFIRDGAEAVTAAGAGRAIVLTGPAGAGTVAVLAHAATGQPGTVLVPGRPGSARYVPYAAAARVHAAITGRAAPLRPAEMLAEAIPAFGGLLAELDQVLIAGINTGMYPIDELAPWVEAAARAVAAGLVEAAHRARIEAVMVDQVGWWDPTSRAVLAHLAATAPEAGLLVVAAEGTERPEAQTWLAELTRHRSVAAVHTMPGLDAAEVETLAVDIGLALAPCAAEQVAVVTGGHPILIEAHLRRLATTGSGRPVPASLTDAALAALETLSTPQRRLVAAAAVSGQVFDSAGLADLCGIAVAAVPDRLDRIAEATGLVTTGRKARGTVGYAWRHETFRDAVLTATDPAARQELHERASRSLITAAAGGPMHLEQWVDICRHEMARGPAWSGPAAQSLLEAADVTYMCCGFAETDQLAALAHSAAEIATHPDRQTLGTAALVYRLLAADRPGATDPADQDRLAAAAEDAAAASGRANYRAIAALARARTLQHTSGLDAQITKLETAHALAQRCTTDPTLPQAAAIAYARQWAKRDLGAARQLLADTETSWHGRELTSEELLWYNLGQMYYGILSFDAGDFDTARTRLTSALAQAELTQIVQVPASANFAAQLHLAIGEGTEADRVLRHALEAEDSRGLTTAWGAYNRALLAEHHARTRAPGAAAMARRAWDEVRATGHPNLVPLVRLHLAETLAHTAAGEADLQKVLRWCAEADAEARASDQPRLRIKACALAAEVQRRLGNRSAADLESETALHLLAQIGDAPALDRVEVLYRCALARPTGLERASVMQRAREAVTERAEAITSPRQRATYLAAPLPTAVRKVNRTATDRPHRLPLHGDLRAGRIGLVDLDRDQLGQPVPPDLDDPLRDVLDAGTARIGQYLVKVLADQGLLNPLLERGELLAAHAAVIPERCAASKTLPDNPQVVKPGRRLYQAPVTMELCRFRTLSSHTITGCVISTDARSVSRRINAWSSSRQRKPVMACSPIMPPSLNGSLRRCQLMSTRWRSSRTRI